MILNRGYISILATLLAFVLCVACTDPQPEHTPDNPTEEPPGNDEPEVEEPYEDIKVVDGKVRFYLKERANSTRTATGLTARDWAKSKVELNGQIYSIEFTDEKSPRPYIEVPQADSYEAVLLAASSDKWYNGSPKGEIKLPYSQFYHTATTNIKAFPMYASYSTESGNKLHFEDGFAMIYLQLKGTAKISSIKVENPSGEALAGISNVTSSCEYAVHRGFDFAVLNCTNKSNCVQLIRSKSTPFRVMIAPGSYPKGLKITICDTSHQAVFLTTESLTLSAGDIHTIEMDYAPDADLVYYEGFDNMVWGGDVMKGSEGFGFAPTSDAVTIDSGATLTGYEDAFAEVAYNSPGTGFIQSNRWSDVKGHTVAQSHRLSDNYIMSRNIGDVNCMFRVQEHPGYIAIGAATDVYGLFASPNAAGTKTIGRVKATARFALQAGFTGNLQVEAVNGGVIESATLDGVPIDMQAANLRYETENSIFTLPSSSLPIPSSQAAPKEWHTIEMVVNAATDGTRFYISDEDLSSGVHGIYLDSIEMRQIDEWIKSDGTLRVLYWNVLCGMWCDQHNNFNNFVKWVKKYDPDVCVWCEAETIYRSHPLTGSLNESDKILPDGWAAIARSYKHFYVEVGGDHDNYPQAITSKYPIKTIKKITTTDDPKKPIVHGAGHFTIEVNHKNLNFVIFHMWPKGYAYGIESEGDQNADKAKNGGDYYREYEMQYIVNNTVNHPNYAGEEHWILCGDTNSRSRLDAWYHNFRSDDPILLTNDVVRKQTNLKDVIGDRYPSNYFMSSTYENTRIDFLYASPSLYDRIENSIMLIDEWCYPRKNGNIRDFYAPSDHRPILVDFKIK